VAAQASGAEPVAADDRGYLKTLDLFRDFLAATGMPSQASRTNREHVETFVADQPSWLLKRPDWPRADRL
jgi:hypothetical protein